MEVWAEFGRNETFIWKAESLRNPKNSTLSKTLLWKAETLRNAKLRMQVYADSDEVEPSLREPLTKSHTCEHGLIRGDFINDSKDRADRERAEGILKIPGGG